jgi:two-component system chemotaxis sensor kinase CheA
MSRSQALPDDVLASIRVLFFQDCDDLLGELETALLAMQRGEHDQETINSAFRAVHSIKGSAPSFELDALAAFAHRFESALAAVRSGAVSPEPALVQLMLRAADVMADLARAGRDGPPLAAGYGAEVAAELAAVSASVVGDDMSSDVSSIVDFDSDSASVSYATPRSASGPARWSIRFTPDAGLYAKGGEVGPLLRELGRLGELSVSLDDRDVPLIQDLHPEKAYLTWTATLVTEADEAVIREVFLFVEDDCDLTLARAEAEDEPAPDLAASDPPEFAAPPAPRQPPPGETVRVDLGRLDRLVNLVGELLINQAMLVQRLSDPAVVKAAGAELPVDDLQRLTRELQDGVMAMRAQPVKVVFQRMPRLVRELEAATGKQVDLELVGEDCEVDRTVIERLADPLIHMVRNAVDHGIEPSAQRLAAGKPARGRIRLCAAHRAGRIIIEVSDDGAGLDRERVRRQAIERRLIDAAAVLDDDEVDALIFAPGFSTATELSDLSGRGVGMDVVKRSVESIGGRVGFTSRPGEGATFVLSMPLTLAVLDGMTVEVCGEKLVAPLSGLVEAVRLTPETVKVLGPDVRLLSFRGQHLPLIDLGALFGYRHSSAERGVALVVEDERGEQAALLVDDILDQRQVVIRSLEANYRPVEGVAAATILGDGRVAFILDIHAILASQRRDAEAEPKP